MRRAHRRAHVLLWLLVAPATMAGLILALLHREPTPFAAAPDAIVGEAP